MNHKLTPTQRRTLTYALSLLSANCEDEDVAADLAFLEIGPSDVADLQKVVRP